MSLTWEQQQKQERTAFIKKITKIGTIAALFLVLLFVGVKSFVTVGAKEVVVIEYPNGKLQVYTSPGIKPQWFGSVTVYKKSFQYNFEEKDGQAIKVRFNDGGHGDLSGSCRINFPLDEGSVILLHTRYGSQDAIEAALVRPTIEKVVYMTGPLMSSKESSNTKRTDLLNYLSDQAEFGVYRTRQVEKRLQEDGSDTAKIVTVVEILRDTAGRFYRQEQSPFKALNIGFGNLSINSLKYDSAVEKQIRSQQELAMKVQTAIAEAKTAEQQLFTTQKQGEANAAAAKWEQEKIKAQKVTEAEQELAVQQLNEKKAASYKQQQILEGEGEAEKKRLIMNANGALDVKLEAWVKSQQYWAEAFSKFQGNLVPLYQSGGTNGGNAINWMEIMGMKAAKDLNLDLSNKK